MTREERKQAHTSAIIKLVSQSTAAEGIDIRTSEQRVIVIEALREVMQFFAHPTRWD
jgi:hypothetical protein